MSLTIFAHTPKAPHRVVTEQRMRSVTRSRRSQTLIDIPLTMRALIVGGTLASVRVHHVHAAPSVEARVRSALVYVDGAELSFPSRLTGACVRVDAILTECLVLTVMQQTFIDVNLAALSLETRLARAEVGVKQIPTNPVV